MNTENLPHLEETAENYMSEKILKETGLDSKPVNDQLHYHESDEHGPTLIRTLSTDILEEDMAQMERHETLLDESTHKKIVEESFRDTLRILGEYVPSERLQNLFPGITLNDLDSYDFSLSKVKVSVLESNDFAFLANEFFADKQNAKGVAGFTVDDRSKRSRSVAETERDIFLGEKKLIVVAELYSGVKKRMEEDGGKFPRELTESEESFITNNLKFAIVHEFIHNLNVATDLPTPLREGITDWYAHQVVEGEMNDDNFFIKDNLLPGYAPEAECVSILVNAMQEGGVELETIDKAFISSDANSRSEVVDFISNRYGQQAQERIMKWDFKSPSEAINYITDLESKQDSDIGRFLRTYKRK